MIPRIRYRFYYSLATVSLVLLTGFLAYWNYNNYHRERIRLSERSHLLFENAIRNVEEGFWEDFILDSIRVRRHNQFFAPRFKMRRQFSGDTLVIFSDSMSFTDTIHNSDFGLDVVSITEAPHVPVIEERRSTWVFQTDTSDVNRDFGGMMSIHIVNTDENGEDSMRIELLDSIMYSDVTAKISETGVGDIAVVRVNDRLDSLKTTDIVTGAYTDHFTGARYAARVSDYQFEIWKRMWPQAGFSLMLLLVTGFAFGIILRSLRHQEKLAALKNDFISNMTHELKTPITTVGVALEALRNFNAMNNPEKSKEYIDISQKELQRLTILVDKVLKMALFEKDRPELKLEEVNIKELIEEVVSSMRLQFEKFKGQCDFDYSGLNFRILADRTHLTSVLYNLIDNALKYSKDEPEISIFLEEQDNGILMSVEDNGIGIADEYKEKVFDKFFRIPSGDKHNVKGYGLGLAYIKSVVLQHHGDIKVESGLNRGTKFTITLPKENGKA